MYLLWKGRKIMTRECTSGVTQKDIPIKLVTLHPDMVVPTDLVCPINPSHKTVVVMDTDWTTEVFNMALLGSTLHSGGICR